MVNVVKVLFVCAACVTFFKQNFLQQFTADICVLTTIISTQCLCHILKVMCSMVDNFLPLSSVQTTFWALLQQKSHPMCVCSGAVRIGPTLVS